MTKISKIILSISSIVLLVSGLLVTTAYATESLPNDHENQEFHEEALFGPVLEGENYIIIDDNPLSRMAGRWQQRGTFWYFYPSGGGARLANTWMRSPLGNWYWFDLNGRMATGWRTIGGRRFFFNPRSGLANHRTGIGGEGVMHTGWSEIDRNWFFFNPAQGRPGHRTGIGGEGALHIGWSRVPITRTSNTLDWFFFQPAGQMTTGWRNIPINNSGGRLSYHYFHSSGRWHVNAFARPVRNASGFGSTFNANTHPGIDIQRNIIPHNEPVLAVAPGRVVTSRWCPSNSFGYYVIIEHNVNGLIYFTLYAHLRYRGSAQGTIVREGTQIGTIGNTGSTLGDCDANGNWIGPNNRSCGHLHFELHRTDSFNYSLRWQSARNPVPRLNLLSNGWGNVRMLQPIYVQNTALEPVYINHPIVGVWNLVSADSYNYNGEHVFDIITYLRNRGDDIGNLLTIRTDGTANSNGFETTWTTRDGIFIYASDISGHYSFEDDTLILTRYYPDGSFSRRVYIKVR